LGSLFLHWSPPEGTPLGFGPACLTPFRTPRYPTPPSRSGLAKRAPCPPHCYPSPGAARRSLGGGGSGLAKHAPCSRPASVTQSLSYSVPASPNPVSLAARSPPSQTDPARRSLGEGGLRASGGSYAHKGMHMAWMPKARNRRKKPQKLAKNLQKTAKKCQSATTFSAPGDACSEKTAPALPPGPMTSPKSPKIAQKYPRKFAPKSYPQSLPRASQAWKTPKKILDTPPNRCMVRRTTEYGTGNGKAVKSRRGPAAVSEDERPRPSHCPEESGREGRAE